MIDDAPDKLSNIQCQYHTSGQVLKFLAQTLTLQRLTPIRMRRTTLRIIPRRCPTVAQRFTRLAPGPRLHQRMHPDADVKGTHVGPNVPQLLLPQTLYLLQVMEVLFDRETIRRQADSSRPVQRRPTTLASTSRRHRHRA